MNLESTKGRSIFDHPLGVYLEEVEHKYFDVNGKQYMSQSAFVGQFKNKFDADFMAPLSAKKQLKEAGKKFTEKDIDDLSDKLKVKWAGAGEEGANHGNFIHNPLEFYGKGKINQVDKSFYPLCEEVYVEHLGAGRWFNEQVLFLEFPRIAGTADLPIARTNSFKPIIDIEDFKTNKMKGIEFRNKYGQYMKFPLEHLEDCNYNHYALQLSLYAYMIYITFGLKIGSLNIKYIKAELNKDNTKLLSYQITKYPVPFMIYEIESMIEWHIANENL